MRESRNTEFKETVSNTFLKTVSAFANYGTGEIYFGITDEGTEIGIHDPVKVCLDIENRINDSLNPVPEYRLEIDNATSVIKLTVKEGPHKPYLYKSKAYRRNDSATIEVDRLDLTRLILDGQDTSYEELATKEEGLTFNTLEQKLKEKLLLTDFSEDTLKTLELDKPGQGLNIAGELLADKNSFPGIDLMRFGDSISIILDRETFENESLLLQYDQAIETYRKYYQYEQIRGAIRNTVSLIPEEAFRESIANALVHRAWDVKAPINVAMFSDRIEITSPGGLPKGISKEDYFKGGLSLLRNRIIATVFLRLGMIERFGTGIRRIIESYQNSERKPIFDISDSSIRISLPVILQKNDLSDDENKVYEFIKGRTVASSTIVEMTGFGKNKVVKILKKLVEDGYIHTTGSGRGLKYTT
ncbi:MAG: ATP-binding protein [Lachnospiraceae bacterium]|nr:ATP-binding protein [Lachnospiraceae bacterium]